MGRWKRSVILARATESDDAGSPASLLSGTAHSTRTATRETHGGRLLGHAQVIPLHMRVETIQVLGVYPLFALSWRQLIRWPRLQPMLSRTHRAAASGGGAVRRFGIVGRFLFVFVPFWMTGPVVGAIIGFLIGLRPWVNLVVVLGATCVAIGVWGLMLNELSD